MSEVDSYVLHRHLYIRVLTFFQLFLFLCTFGVIDPMMMMMKERLAAFFFFGLQAGEPFEGIFFSERGF